jgi:DNA-directed RNA polymerase sigma subunit (sigma70/sigma32)
MIKRIKHWLECRKLDIPTRYEIYEAYQRLSNMATPDGKRKMGATSQSIMFMYLAEVSLEDMAKSVNFTRKRVRQILWKIVRTSKLQSRPIRRRS